MSNITQVTLAAGVPVAGSGNVSTIDALLQSGMPLTSLPVGANQIGNVSITSHPPVVVGQGLPVGANQIGNVSITTIPSVTLGLGANQIGNVSITALPGLPSGANVVGSVTNAPANNKIGIVQIGNSTGGVIDNFAAATTISSGLPVGANQIGNVSITALPSLTIGAGLPTGANTIGAIAAITGGLPAGANQIGNVSITSMPAIPLGALATGANTIGSINAIVAGLPTGANTIGAIINAPANNKIGIVQIGNSSGGIVDNFGISGTFSGALATGANIVGGVFLHDNLSTANATIKAANTLPANNDTALVVTIHPTSSNPDGQSNMAGSTPVVIASDQSPVSVNILRLPVGANTIGGVLALGDSNTTSLDTGSNPVKIGILSSNTNPPNVNTGFRQNVWGDARGRIMVGATPRSLKGVGGNTFNSVTTNQTIIPAISGVFTDIFGIIITNNSAVNTAVFISDGTQSYQFLATAQNTITFSFDTDSAIPATTLNTAWTANCATSVSSVAIKVLYVQTI